MATYRAKSDGHIKAKLDIKVNHRLVSGPADEDDVVAYLREAFDCYGAPLVLKHDGGSIFHGEQMVRLLEEY